MSTETPVRHAGRPRRTSTDRAILHAAVELMTEDGVDGATLAAVARRANVARATVYLRWPTRAALLGAATKAVVGGDPFVLTGDLERDIRTGADFIRQVVEAPYFNVILPELVRATLATPTEIAFDDLAPNREGLAREYRQLAEAQGFDPAYGPDHVFDVLFGAALSHLLATGSGPSRAESRQTAEILIAGLRHR